MRKAFGKEKKWCREGMKVKEGIIKNTSIWQKIGIDNFCRL